MLLLVDADAVGCCVWAIVTCVDVSVHLFFYCSVVIACLYVVGHVVVSCIWELRLIPGRARYI
jgi:hypothetical protein